MDWNSFLRSDEFVEYRKRQMLVIAKNIKAFASQVATKGDPDIARLSGKLEIIQAFMRFPESLTDDPKLKEVLRIQLDEDLNGIAQNLLRETLRGENRG